MLLELRCVVGSVVQCIYDVLIVSISRARQNTCCILVNWNVDASLLKYLIKALLDTGFSILCEIGRTLGDALLRMALQL